jgi:hypothetical protein
MTEVWARIASRKTTLFKTSLPGELGLPSGIVEQLRRRDHHDHIAVPHCDIKDECGWENVARVVAMSRKVKSSIIAAAADDEELSSTQKISFITATLALQAFCAEESFENALAESIMVHTLRARQEPRFRVDVDGVPGLIFRMNKKSGCVELRVFAVSYLKHACVTCSKPARQKCSKCQEAYYCSYECQKADWKAGHKTECAEVIEDDCKENTEPQ